jgi:NAD(P)-dependent dehydrogenase (short-subunit alcohol dehydrogenase family)
MSRYAGRTALVVGGTLGIGKAAAERLAREGARVVTGGREDDADLPGDVRDESYAQALVERCGELDVLVYTAGIQRYGTVETTNPETWDEVFAVNVRGAYLCARAAVPAMRARGGGAIVIVSSVQATASQTGVAAYAASKGALSTLARTMALDHVGDGIRVNSVAPGSVDTPMLRWAADQFRGESSVDEVVAQWGRFHPLGRVISPDEVAAAIAYLGSDDASAVTGAELRVDGGLLASLPVELPR